MTKPKRDWPKVNAEAAGTDGTNYQLLEYPRRRLQLVEFRRGKLQRILELQRSNLHLAFGREDGDRIWTHHWPKVIAEAAGADGIYYQLLEYRRCRYHLAEFRRGRLQRFVKLRRSNLRRAFGRADGDRIWSRLLRLRQAQRR